MTVNTQPVPALPDPREYGLPVVEAADITPELRSLVARVHDLIDAVANTEADTDTLAQTAATVETLTDRLNVARRDVGAMVQRDLRDGTVEYGTITNIVAGDTNPVAPPLSLERTTEGLRGDVTLTTTYQGPPGLVHGGWIAALLDQAVGSAAALAGMPGLTARLEVDYRRPTPLFTPLEITSRVTGAERRKVFVAGEIRVNGEVTAEATAIMVRFELPEPGA
ncbi:PaaI family thioesterase [Nocardiopsis sp. NPDC049922]|uniref:PaaI family thioesterase n=1 Tax=Nocardiopsis sp. NPDC049922 TaxID=3155157 RepID=UPI0033DF50D6